MNRRDLPAGHKLIILEARGVDPGDILIEHGPRIGERWWQVLDIHHARTYDHAHCAPIDPMHHGEAHHAAAEARNTVWTLTRP